MDRSQLPLNALRAFEAAARHLNFTRAAAELCVSQAALSHQIKALEARLGVPLFRRLPRGVALTDEGNALIPALRDSFDRMGRALDLFGRGAIGEVVTLGVVATFATGWLLPRLAGFYAAHPGVDLRLLTNNNRPDLAGEGLDFAIRFGDGSWHGIAAVAVMPAPLTPMGSPALMGAVDGPEDLVTQRLLRSFRPDEWPGWFAGEGLSCPKLTGPMFDSSLAIAWASAAGTGVGLLPAAMFAQELASGRLVAPFARAVDAGQYWLTRLNTRPETPGMAAFREWLLAESLARNGS
jgi:LysR family transcriptional regulator, regulator of gene expression of beta-lactamase